MTSISKTLYLVTCITLFIVIQGCTVSNVITLQPLNRDQIPQANEGMLYVTLVNAGPSSTPFNYLKVSPKDLNTGEGKKNIEITANPRIQGSGSVYAAYLPEGTYALSSLIAYYSNADRYYVNGAPIGPELGTFTVKTGQLTDLGTLIYYQKPDGENYLKQVVKGNTRSSGELFNKYYAHTKFNIEEALSWSEDEELAEEQSSYASIAQNPTSYNRRYMSDDGELYFIGKLGAIVKRNAEAVWSLDGVATDYDLHAIRKSKSGTLAIAGDHGRFFIKALGGEWQQFNLPIHYQVREILFDEKEKVVALAKAHNDVAIFENAIDSMGAWKKTRFYSVKGWHNEEGQALRPELYIKKGESFTPRWMRYLRAHRLSPSSSEYLIFIGRQRDYSDRPNRGAMLLGSPLEKIFKYNIDDNSIAKTKGFDNGFENILSVGATKIGVKKGGFFSGGYSLHSYDKQSDAWRKMITKVNLCPGANKSVEMCKIDGKIYRKAQAFNMVSLPVFFNSNDVIVVARSKLYKSGDVKNYLVKSTDGGLSWLKLKAELPSPFCISLVPEINSGLLLTCDGASSNTYFSKDEGKTWDLVREHQVY